MSSADNNIARLFRFLKDNPAFAGSLNTEALIAQIEQAVSDFPHEDSIKSEYSDMLINLGRYEKAHEVIHQLIDSGSNNYFAHYLQAKCYYLNGALKEAQYPIIKCLELQPNYDEGRFLLAKIFLKARQYEKAQRIFEYYQKVFPYERRSEIYIAKCLYNSGGSEAAAAYSESLLKDRSAARPYIAMLHAYHLSNIEQYDKAFSIIYEHSVRESVTPVERALLNMINAFLLSLSARNESFEDFMTEASSLLKDAGKLAGISNQPLFLLYRNFAATIYNMKLKNYRRMNAAAELVLSFKNNYDAEDYIVFEFEEFNNIYSLAKLQSLKSEAEKDVETGCMHINANNFNAGVRYLESADAKMPGDISILNRLGEAYILINQMNKAIKTFERIKVIDPKNIESFKRTSEIYMSSGNYEKFISECRQILALDPGDYYSRFYIGEYLFKNGNYPEAEEFLRYLISRIEDEFKTVRSADINMMSKEIYEKASFIMAQIAFKDGVRENAILYLNNVININPENEKAYELLNKLKQSRQDKEVMLLLREADEKENEKDYTEAMHVFENIIEINPQFIEAHYRLAKNLMKQKNFERAVFELERIFDYNYKSYERLPEIYLTIALISFELSKIDGCREALGKLSEISSDNSMTLMLLYLHKASFLIFGNSPDYNAFVDGLIESRINGKADFITDFSIGYTVFNTPKWIFEDKKIFETAMDAAREAYESDTEDIYAAFVYAQALEKTGEIFDAYQHFRVIADLDLEVSPAVAHTAKKYSLINNTQNLSISFYKFVLLDNLNMVNFINSAVLKVAYHEEKQGNLESAVHYYNRSAKLTPDNFVPAMKSIELFLAMALADKNLKISKISSFIKSLKKDISAYPERADIRFQLGYLYFKLPDDLDVLGSTIENVVMELKHSISVNNGYIPSYAAIREVYEKLGATNPKMYNTALETLKRGFESIDEKNPYMNVEMGNCYYYYYGRDMKNDALESFKKAIFYRCDLTEAHFKLASIYRMKKDYEKAILHYGIVYDLEPAGPYADECVKSMSTLKRRHMIE